MTDRIDLLGAYFQTDPNILLITFRTLGLEIQRPKFHVSAIQVPEYIAQ